VTPEEFWKARTIERWAESAGHHADPPHVHQERLRVLEAFCNYTERSPDELVAFCFLRKRATGDRFVSVKRRVTVNEWLAAFVAEQGWKAKEAVQKANIVRSFLIHNGVLIQGDVWRGD